MCFPVNFAKFLRTLFLRNTSGGCLWTLFAVQTVKISNNNLFSKYDLQKKFLMESFTITPCFPMNLRNISEQSFRATEKRDRTMIEQRMEKLLRFVTTPCTDREISRLMYFKAEAYSEPYLTFKTECLAKTFNGFQPLIIFAYTSILDILQGSKYTYVKVTKS